MTDYNSTRHKQCQTRIDASMGATTQESIGMPGINIQSQIGINVSGRSRPKVHTSVSYPFLTTTTTQSLYGSYLHIHAFNQVLQGNFQCPLGVDPMAQCLLVALAWPLAVPTIPQRTLDEITTGWCRAWEATSLSPSGIHFGHYMAGTFNLTIAIFNTRPANLGFIMGYSMKYWQTRLNVMLEKQKGNLNVEKLQIILLFEGDFNNNNKWLGRAVMFNAKAHNQMAPEQYGSCKEKSAAIQCLNKCLLYNYVCYTHTPLAVCSNDAKSCYDRIVLIIAALSLCQLGVDKAAVQSMISTLHGMQHHVWSTFGDSKTSQGRKVWGAPIAGIGQGNGAPQIWAAVSTPFFQILAEVGFLALMICAITSGVWLHQQHRPMCHSSGSKSPNSLWSNAAIATNTGIVWSFLEQ